MQDAIVAISLGISQGETYMIEIVGFDTNATLAYVSCMFVCWNFHNLEIISQKGSFTLAFKNKVVYFKSNGPIGYGNWALLNIITITKQRKNFTPHVLINSFGLELFSMLAILPQSILRKATI